MMFARGLKPARPEAVKLKFGAYLKAAELPQRPDEFGHETLVADYHMFGNDKYGNCAWAGAAHETLLWNTVGGHPVQISTMDVLDDYRDCTGFNMDDPSTDEGTDMQQAASYRRKTGIRDMANRRHKIAAYVAVDPHNLDEVLTAAWLFGAVGLGVQVGQESEQQFATGQPWDGAPGANPSGHYVPLVAYRGGKAVVITWGKTQRVMRSWLESNLTQAMAYLSPEMLRDGKSLEGFDLAALKSDLEALTA